MSMSTTTIRKPLGDLNNNTVVGPPPSKKARTFDQQPSIRSQVVGQKKQPSHEPTVDNEVLEVLIRNWLALPQSQFGIRYDLGSTRTYKHPPTLEQNGMAILQMAVNKCPFELKMQELKNVLLTKYPTGAGLVYIREIFEPQDPGWQSLGPTVDVTSITQEQMSRLRLMICDEKRREEMLSYLSFYGTVPHEAACNVVDHFDAFKKKYAKLRDHRVKFNRIFCFTFCLKQFDGWMYRMERGWGRSRMVEGLATRWKNLLNSRTPHELGLDTEFSYPAVKTLLEILKVKVELAPTYGDPRMVFKYE